jgi:virulence-associated protein VagC
MGNELIITALEPSWDVFFDESSAFGDDFMDNRDDSSAQEPEPF